MSLDHWLIALHLLSAFALVGALTIFSIVLAAVRRVDTPGRVLALQPSVRVAGVAVMIGVVGTIVFGAWLAISLDAYSIWDGWILAAIVLWAAGSELGRRSGVIMGRAFERAEQLGAEGRDAPDAELAGDLRSTQALALHWVSTALFVLILLDMIWKPGA